MQSIPDKSVDMILADWPYGITACRWDSVIPLDKLWAECKRVTKDNGAFVLFSAQPFTTHLIVSNIKQFKYCWVWDKGSMSNYQQANIRPLNYTEDIAVFGEGRITYNPQMVEKDKPLDTRNWKTDKTKLSNELDHCGSKVDTTHKLSTHSYPSNILRFNARAGECNNLKRVHPTQKPVAILEYLIRTYTNEGETVLDNTMGSGSTGVAAQNTGRNFIGIEEAPGYFETAQKRLGVWEES
jgi:site-specific DNA-methyltransferase (adenine-specific)